MRILTIDQIRDEKIPGSVVTIGNFDGVHRGHLEMFRRLVEAGRELGFPSIVVTFSPHPLVFLAPDKAPPMITTLDQKIALIAEAGIDYLLVVEFTRAFSEISADEFVRDILCDSLQMRHIVIGHDYAFGRNRQGNYETLTVLGNELGFTLEDLDPVGEGDTVFSSTLVRKMIAAGDVAGASEILGRYHLIVGQVVHGREIGHMLGFPTANIATCNELIPADGVYAVIVTIEDQQFSGACNIGASPTFETQQRTVEVFILDFSGELYGRDISICFIERLRGVKKFSDVKELISAISHDVETTRIAVSQADPAKIKLLPGRSEQETF